MLRTRQTAKTCQILLVLLIRLQSDNDCLYLTVSYLSNMPEGWYHDDDDNNCPPEDTVDPEDDDDE